MFTMAITANGIRMGLGDEGAESGGRENTEGCQMRWCHLRGQGWLCGRRGCRMHIGGESLAEVWGFAQEEEKGKDGVEESEQMKKEQEEKKEEVNLKVSG